MPLKMRVNKAKSQFFDRQSVMDDLDEKSQKGLSRFGAFLRRGIRSTLKKARQKKIAELTKEERRRFRIQQAIAKRDGLPRPKRPFASANPGEPPRMRKGLIKKLLFFAWDPATRSVVTGPAEIDRPTGAPRTLEEGGHAQSKNGRFRIEARPYMKPEFHELLPSLPQFLAGIK